MNDIESENCVQTKNANERSRCVCVCVDSSDDECDICKHSDSEMRQTNYIAARKLNQNNYGRDVKSHKDSQERKKRGKGKCALMTVVMRFANQRRNYGALSGHHFLLK